MKGVDTNVLARYLLRDDRNQAMHADRFLNSCSAEDPCFINRIVLCELVWVLERGYKRSRAEIVSLMSRLFQTAQIVIEDYEEAVAALTNYARGGGFADNYLAETNRRLGCDRTMTFDRKAAKNPNFQLL